MLLPYFMVFFSFPVSSCINIVFRLFCLKICVLCWLILHFNLATTPTYLVNHYSRSVCKGVSEWDSHLKCGSYLPKCGWVSSNHLKALIRQKTDLSKQDIIQQQECLYLDCVSSLSIGCQPILQILDSPGLQVSEPIS